MMVAFRITLQAQLKRIQFKSDSKFIHCAFEGIDRGHRARGAHVTWRSKVELRDLYCALRCRIYRAARTSRSLAGGSPHAAMSP